MEFIYRLPSLTLDPSSGQEIEDNYAQILKMVQLSSSDFFTSIKDTPYQDLSAKEKVTLFKYLLRGRYRPTPFGLWAGVGLGNFGEKFSYQECAQPYLIAHDKNIVIRYTNKKEIREKIYYSDYVINSGASLIGDKVYFWDKDKKTYKWKEQMLDYNPVFEKAIDHLHHYPTLNYTEFRRWFTNVPLNSVRSVWMALIFSGLVLAKRWNSSVTRIDINKKMANVRPTKLLEYKEMVDLYFSDYITQPYEIKRQLENINEEMGSLFYQPKSLYLENFKTAFLKDHDDRYVLMSKIIHPYTNLNTHFKSKKWSYDQSLKPRGFAHLSSYIRSGNGIIDLKGALKSMPLDNSPETTILYRLGHDGKIVLDTISCRRTFALSGRFTLSAKIENYFKSLANSYYESPSVIYADVDLDETPLVNQLSQHRNLLSYSITLFGRKDNPKTMDFGSLWIGIHDGEVIIYSKVHQKRVIPVFQHSVDPKHITHPLARLLWEVAHQNRAKSVTDHYNPSELVPHVPQLNWGELVVKPAAWLIQENEALSIGELRAWVEKMKVPRHVLIGNLDQELLIDLECRLSVEIFMSELTKNKKLVLKECLWIQNESFKTEEGKTLYPQFSVSLPQKEYRFSDKKLFFNPKVKPDPLWLSFKIYLSPADAVGFLQTQVKSVLDNELVKKNQVRWYYLAYDDGDFHLKLRLKIRESQKEDVQKTLFFLLAKNPIIQSVICNDYYPETAKYGFKSISISERIFQMESELAVDMEGPLLNVDHEQLYLMLVALGEKLIIGSKKATSWKNRYKKDIVTSYNRAERRAFSKFHLAYIDGKEMDPRFDQILEAYCEELSYHEYWEQEDKVHTLIENHLHMFINRLFPESPQLVEPMIWNCIYRKVEEYLHRPVVYGYIE
ncbi:thiopeptide-type bacteriocin biosynthesis protein [Litoribacter populi]|uniref:thiopeptide-type bacteriocin biosynthesis protein n=1 Tax=Litoribacter populi TaxID=2598460 RepID=UPI00117CA1A0|nr:thiopeptide-type bacteriocin biosynthesis protein [Litoribacter populi]